MARSGALNRPYAIPGDDGEILTVTLNRDLEDPNACDGASPGFPAKADEVVVTVVFTPPMGPRNAVVLATDCAALADDLTTCEPQLGGGLATCFEVNGPTSPGAVVIEDVGSPPIPLPRHGCLARNAGRRSDAGGARDSGGLFCRRPAALRPSPPPAARTCRGFWHASTSFMPATARARLRRSTSTPPSGTSRRCRLRTTTRRSARPLSPAHRVSQCPPSSARYGSRPTWRATPSCRWTTAACSS